MSIHQPIILLGLVHWLVDFLYVKLIKSELSCRVYCLNYNFSFLKNVSHLQGKYDMDIDQTRTMFKSLLAYNQEKNNTNIIRNNLKSSLSSYCISNWKPSVFSDRFFEPFQVERDGFLQQGGLSLLLLYGILFRTVHPEYCKNRRYINISKFSY